MRRRFTAIGHLRTACLAIAIALASPAHADDMTPQSLLESLFETGTLDRKHFAPTFLQKLPAEEVARLVASLRETYGPLRQIRSAEGAYMVELDRAEVPSRVVLDAEGRIAGIWFGAPQLRGDLESHAATIRALPGDVSLLVLTDGKTVVGHEPDRPMAVGSAFKLAVLAAAGQAVSSGRLNWSDVIDLKSGWRSLPTGILQDWPEGAPLTVAALANLMISLSDNTATDAMIDLVGREAVETFTPRNAPLLTTREAFVLKAKQNAALRRRWAEGDVQSRRAMLGEIAAMPLPAADDLAPEPSLEVEWFMTATELCRLLEATADLPSFQINPGPVEPRQWRGTAFKGGSETGVLNLSSLVIGKDGRRHCVVATWNGDGPLDEQALLAPYRGLLAELAKAPD